MEKVHCNIIRDLLPSYVDEITSEESNQMIEEHFKECESCKKAYDSLKKHDFVADRADAGVAGYLMRMGKKKRIEHRGMFALTFFLFLLQIFLNFSNYVLLPYLYIVNCIFYPMYVILLLNVLGTWKVHGSCFKMEKVIFTVEGISLFYMLGIFYYLFIIMANGGELPFGLEVRQTGPFLDSQIKGLLVVYFLLLLLYFIFQRKVKHYNQNIVIMLSGGAAILWNVRAAMYQMAGFRQIIKTVSIFLAVVLAESIVLCGLYRKLRK